MAVTTAANILTWVGYRLFPDGSTVIASTSEPTEAECLQWVNETCQELLTVCIQMGSEIGRTLGSVTLADGTASYDDLVLMLAPSVMYDNDGNAFNGWIEKTNVRNPLILTTEAAKINYDPALESEPSEFYFDGASNIIFLPTPDDTYTANIPYYAQHTTISATGTTIPFLKIFDTVIVESVTMRAQNREEYDLSFELKWFSYIRKQAKMILSMRQNPQIKVVV